VKRKTSHPIKAPRKHNRLKAPKRTISVVGAGLVYFVAIVLFLGAIWMFLPNKNQSTNRCANEISCATDLSGNYDDNNQGTFNGQIVQGPAIADKPYIARVPGTNEAKVLGASTGNKHIYVDLSKQHLYAYEGNTLVYDFLVSTGKWYPTPTGDFQIWIKLKYTRMTGGNKAIGTYYDLPNVPFTMFFYNNQYPKSVGYGLHGAYWHNNFGHPMSHGCVNLSIADSETLYNWAEPATTGNTTNATADHPGTPVTIYGVTPQS
jgi:lipoprotein-anchoring transpeptidase ErfK/SrfK